MPVTSAISMRPNIHGLRSIGVQQKLPWQCTSDDGHNVCHSTGVPPANGKDRHTACRVAGPPSVSGVDRAHEMLRRHIARQWSGPDSLNAGTTHRLPGGVSYPQ
jgi:hypothetical protein